MTTTDDERHTRICLMLMKGGTKISKALFEKCVKVQTPEEHIPHPWTLDHFLNANKTKILTTQTGKAKQNILFPKGGASTQVEVWDLNMNCFFLIEICCVERHVRMDIDQLRKIRNKICHQNEPKIDIEKYNRTVDKLEVIYERLLKEVGDEVLTNEVNKILKTSKEDPLSHKETIFAMHTFYKTDLETREILTQQIAELSELSCNFRSLMKQVDEIQKKQDLMFSLGLADSESENCTETCVELRIKNCVWSTERFLSNVLVDMYKKETGQPSNEQLELSEETRAELMAAVRDTVATFASMNRAIIDAEQKCVILLIQCSSVSSLRSLFYDCINGDLTKEFRQVESAIRHMTRLQEVSLEAVIYKDEFYRTMQRTVSVLDDSVNKTYDMHLQNLQTRNTYCITDVRLVERLLPYSDDERQSQHAVRITIKTDADRKTQLRDSIKSGSLDKSVCRLKEEMCKHYNLTNLSIEAKLLEERCGLFEDDYTVEDDHRVEDDHSFGNDHSFGDDHRIGHDQSIEDDHKIEESYRVEDNHKVGDDHRLGVDHITEVDHIAEVDHIVEEEIDRIFDDVNTIEDKDTVVDRLIFEDKDELSNNWNESKDEDPLSNESKMHSSSNLGDTTCEQYAEDDETDVSNQNCSIKRNPTSIAATQTKYTTKIDQQAEDGFEEYQCQIGETIYYKQLSEASEYLLIGAIDFGTTYSGWAYFFPFEFESDPTKAFVKRWKSGSGNLITEKTPTCVLVKPDGKTLKAFGYEAEDRYIQLVVNDKHEKYFYFQKFKMMLNKKIGEKLDRNITLEDEMGRSLPALDVFAMAIKYFKDNMVKEVEDRLGIVLKAEDVHWVLTVPAIWTDGPRQFMRDAASKAGIYSKHLSIALEPEAASVYCLKLDVETTVDISDVPFASFEAGTRYLILDAGGATINITVNEVKKTGSVEELIAACGVGWGGTIVDKAFENMLCDIFTKKIYEKFKKEETESWLELWRDFEEKKRAVSPTDSFRICMRFPISLIIMYKEITKDSLSEALSRSKFADDISHKGVRFEFSAEVFKSLFQTSIEKTIGYVTGVIRNTNANAIIMVGGFSESPMLQQAVKSSFPDVCVIIPNYASSAILRGALIFGHVPKVITACTERLLQKTYGIETTRTFMKGIDPESKLLKTDYGVRFVKIFDKHVEKNKVVKVGEAQGQRTYTPVYKSQTTICLMVYASDLVNPEYTDQDCIYVGKMSVDLQNHGGDCSRKVMVSLTFSGTEIVVNAIDKKTGIKTMATVAFLG